VSPVVFKVFRTENHELSVSLERLAPATETALQFNSNEVISVQFSSDLYCYLSVTTTIISIIDRTKGGVA